MSPEPYTLGEVVRRLDATSARLDELARTLEDRYVPRREYEQRITEVEKDIATQSAFRRQVGAGALVGLLLLVVNIIVAATRVPGVGG